jgi:hypothetical protein
MTGMRRRNRWFRTRPPVALKGRISGCRVTQEARRRDGRLLIGVRDGLGHFEQESAAGLK